VSEGSRSSPWEPGTSIFGAVGSGPAFVLARKAESGSASACARAFDRRERAHGVAGDADAHGRLGRARPGRVVSLIVAVWRSRETGSSPPAAPRLPPFLVAGPLLPPRPRSTATVGPFGLAVHDAWAMQADLWLQGHSLLDDPPADAGRWDLSLA
jgi:hypothetical protein